MLQPANVATPATAVFGLAVHASAAPAGVVIANVTALTSEAIVLPPASLTATTGWVANAIPPVEAPGCVVNATFAATPTVMTTGPLTAEVSTPSVAVSVYVPVRSMLQPANVATPATAAFGFAVHVNTAPAGVVIASVTELVLPTTVLPAASCTLTAGCVPNAE